MGYIYISPPFQTLFPFRSVQFSSVAQLCPILCDPMDCSTPGFLCFTISQSLLKFVSIELVMPSNHLIFYHPLLLLPSIFSSIRVFSNEQAVCIRWPKYWSFSISPANKYSGLISLKIDWFDLLAIQATLVSLLQNHNLEASVLQDLAFFMVLLSHLSVHEYWKGNRFNNRFSYMDLCWQSYVSAF